MGHTACPMGQSIVVRPARPAMRGYARHALTVSIRALDDRPGACEALRVDRDELPCADGPRT